MRKLHCGREPHRTHNLYHGHTALLGARVAECEREFQVYNLVSVGFAVRQHIASRALPRFAVYAQSGFRLLSRGKGTLKTDSVKSAAIWIGASA